MPGPTDEIALVVMASALSYDSYWPQELTHIHPRNPPGGGYPDRFPKSPDVNNGYTWYADYSTDNTWRWMVIGVCLGVAFVSLTVAFFYM
jgi:hypothetical protein